MPSAYGGSTSEQGRSPGQQWAVTIKLAGQQTLSVTIAPTGLDQGFPGALQPVRQEQDV
jgi:hypothetical protein